MIRLKKRLLIRNWAFEGLSRDKIGKNNYSVMR